MNRTAAPPPSVAATPAVARLPATGALTPQEAAVLAAIRAVPFGAVEVVLHQSRIVQIVRTEKLKVDEAPPRD